MIINRNEIDRIICNWKIGVRDCYASTNQFGNNIAHLNVIASY